MKDNRGGISFFEKYLTIWVSLCIIIGVGIGQFIPSIPDMLSKWEYAHVSIPVAILIWLMIYPMMLKIDFASILHSAKQPKGLMVTLVTNWLIKPFTMFFIAYFFFHIVYKNIISEELAKNYLAGAVLLGVAPCTAMVFVWSYLTKGNPAYTLVQVAINDIVILFAFVPITGFLLGISDFTVPYDTLILSVVFFVVLPLVSAYLTRVSVTKYKGEDFFNNKFIPFFKDITIGGLLLTLIIIFSFQGANIISNPFHIFLIAIPLTIQTFLIFSIAYFISWLLRLKHDIASPAAMIGASNFFELAVAVAIAIFGLNSGATLATVVGVLVEVPVMLTLVGISNRTAKFFK